MPAKTKQLSAKQLLAYEATRDLGAELLESVRKMKAGETKVVLLRRETGLGSILEQPDTVRE